jgi:hypothetical protein
MRLCPAKTNETYINQEGSIKSLLSESLSQRLSGSLSSRQTRGVWIESCDLVFSLSGLPLVSLECVLIRLRIADTGQLYP